VPGNPSVAHTWVQVPGNLVEDKPFVGDRMKVADDRKKALAWHKMVADKASCVASCKGFEEHKKACEEQESRTACDHVKMVVDNVESSGMAWGRRERNNRRLA